MARDFGTVRRESRAGRGAAWFVEVRIDGRRYRARRIPVHGGGSIRITSEELAREVLGAIRDAIRGGRTAMQSIAPFLGADAAMSFGSCWDRFVDAKRRQGAHARQLSTKRVDELASYRRRGYLEPLLLEPVYAVTFGALDDWAAWLFEATKLAPKSVANVVHDVGTCLRWLARRGEILGAPELPTIRVPDHTPRIPTPDVLESLLEAIPWPERGQYLARGYMGLRPSEARRARVADWDFEARTLSVLGKGDRLRVLPGDELVAEWIADRVDPRGALAGALLFARASGAPWSVSASSRVWTAACKAVGLVDADGRRLIAENEGLRHAFGTHAVNRGVPIDRAGAYMGHTNAKTTARYAKLATIGLVDVIRRTPR